MPIAQAGAPRFNGRLAQLGERCLRKAEVGSSNLLPSIQPAAGSLSAFCGAWRNGWVWTSLPWDTALARADVQHSWNSPTRPTMPSVALIVNSIQTATEPPCLSPEYSLSRLRRHCEQSKITAIAQTSLTPCSLLARTL